MTNILALGARELLRYGIPEDAIRDLSVAYDLWNSLQTDIAVRYDISVQTSYGINGYGSAKLWTMVAIKREKLCRNCHAGIDHFRCMYPEEVESRLFAVTGKTLQEIFCKAYLKMTLQNADSD